MKAVNVLFQVVVGVMTVGVVSCVIAIATKHWLDVEHSGSTTEENYGLWESCVEDAFTSSECKSLQLNGSNGDKIKVVRAFSIMAIIVLLISFIPLVCNFSNSFIIFVIVTAIAIFFQMIAMSVYTDEHKDLVKADGTKFGWSFAMGWIGFILPIFGLAGGVILQLSGSEIE